MVIRLLYASLVGIYRTSMIIWWSFLNKEPLEKNVIFERYYQCYIKAPLHKNSQYIIIKMLGGYLLNFLYHLMTTPK